MAALDCIVCWRKMEDNGSGGENSPHGGLVFTASGNYGSMFDPINGTFLNVTICDQCIQAAAVKGQVLMCRNQVQHTTKTRRWVPGKEELEWETQMPSAGARRRRGESAVSGTPSQTT